MTELTTQVANLVTATNTLHEEVVAQKDRLKVAIDEAMSSGGSDLLEPRVKANEDAIVEIKNKAETLAVTVGTLDTRLTAEENKECASTDLTPVTGRLDIIEPKVTTLESAKDSHETRLATAETKVTALENDPALGQLQAKVTTLEATVADLVTRLTKAEADIVALIAVDGTTETTLGTMQADIDALKAHHPA